MSEKITVFQKPTCTKCRATLRLLKERGVEFEAINYYELPLTARQLRALLKKLGLSALDLIRRDEPIARELGMATQTYSEEELIELMAKHPDLVQRPIVVRGNKAVLGRPPENVSKLF